MTPRPPAPPPLIIDPIQAIDRHPVPAVLISVAILIAMVPLGLLARRTLRAAARSQTSTEHVLTVIAAGIATSVAAQGMWQFFGDVLRFSGPLRVLTFAFIEVSVITSAVRARRSMRETYAAGVDGIAVWVLTCLSAVLSSLDAHSFGETVLRLTAPLVAAWLWERGMALERRRITGRTRINWRLTPERVLVRIGLADPTDRNAGEVDAQRRLMRLALAAKHARAARATGNRRAQKGTLRKLDRAMERAVEYGGLDTDPAKQQTLLAQLGLLYNAAGLLDLAPDAPWAPSPTDGPPSDDEPGRKPNPRGRQAPHHESEAGHRTDEPRRQPDPTRGTRQPAPAYATAADDRTKETSADDAADTSGATERNIPAGKTAETGNLTALFLDALTRHDGSVPAARADMEQAGHRPPSRGYAYQLRKKWQSQQATVSGRLTRVI